MSKTVVGLFRNFQEAETVVRELETSGFTHDHVSIVAGEQHRSAGTGSATDAESVDYPEGHVAGDTGGGIAKGAAIGGGIGLVAGLIALAIPGIGPVLAAGPIAAALTGLGVGAAAGGVIGGLSGMGIPEEEHSLYSERLRGGEVMVSVHAENDSEAERAASVMRSYGAESVEDESAAADERIKTYDRPAGSTYTGSTLGGAAGSAASGLHNAERKGENLWEETKEKAQEGWDKTKNAATNLGHDVRRDDESGKWGDSDQDFRSHYEQNYGTTGRTYDYYAPAYNVGSDAATRYSGRQWDEVEPDIRRDFESHGTGAWEEFKAAVRHGWDKVRGTVTHRA